ncbi:MAG: PelD GGDEF domain-containing protein [Granulosicoccus sp.]
MKRSFKSILESLGPVGKQALRSRLFRAKEASTQTGKMIELLAFASVLPLCGILIFPHDPLGLNAGFPWVAAAPLLFAARYGSSWGVACSVLMALVISLPIDVYAGMAAKHLTLSLGVIVLSLMIGDAASAWRKRSRQAEAENTYLRHRLKEFSTDYHVLKVSHGHLEEYMAGQRLSLREALQQVKPVLSTGSDGIHAGSELMAIFSQFCSVQVAGLYAMSSDSVIDSTPIAVHGDMFDLPQFDPLLRLAIEKRELVSIKLESMAEKHHEHSLLAVVPIVDTEGHLHGVLAIKDMHFMAFQQQNLNILALLGSYIGNLLTRSEGEALSRKDWFLSEMDTVLRFAHSHDTESSLLSLKLKPGEKSAEIAHYISATIRNLDASWLPDTDDDSAVVCLLLPLMTETKSLAFLRRIGDAVDQQFGVSMKSILEDSKLKQIQKSDTRETCLALLESHIGKLPGTSEPDSDTDVGMKGAA